MIIIYCFTDIMYPQVSYCDEWAKSPKHEARLLATFFQLASRQTCVDLDYIIRVRSVRWRLTTHS